jgi:flagellar hook assembly protein FlgD
MDEHGAAELDIHNSLGQLVRRLHAGPLPSGEHSLHWDGRDDYGRAVGSGLYQAVLRAQGQVQVRGLTLLK